MPRPERERRTPGAETGPPVGLRIIGGRYRGRRLRYGGDPRVRPMKDRVREAVFNLVGPAIVGKPALDLFAGTGALGLEALSRGAARALFVEQHYPTAAILRENIATLEAVDRAEVVVGNVFFRARWENRLGAEPWVAFCSPPYAFYVDRQAEMLELIGALWRSAPAGSVLVVESDDRFDPRLLPDGERWDVRTYPPAVIALGEP